jgi:hypothetical protein
VSDVVKDDFERPISSSFWRGAGNLLRSRSGDLARPSSISGGAEVPAGSHLSSFYGTDAGRLRLSVPFLMDGLRLGQPCFLIAAGDELDAYLEALGRTGEVNPKAASATDGLIIAPTPGKTASDALSFWEETLGRVTVNGQRTIRGVGEMASVLRAFGSVSEMLAFEVALNVVVKRFPAVLLCQYDVRVFDGVTVVDAIKAHPDLYRLHIENFLS